MDNDYTKEADFFHEIASAILRHVSESLGSNKISVQKVMKGDFATAIDISVENLIVDELQKLFPSDKVLAEEGSFDTEIGSERIWIIDPICGTTNLGREIEFYCTNIALARDGKLVASCVIDHSKKEYYWSIGQGVNKGGSSFEIQDKGDIGVVIDVDHGAVLSVDSEMKQKYVGLIEYFVRNTDYMLSSYNTSLTFLYVAIGKLNGAFNIKNNPWDVCASVFLITQMGGIVTDIDGSPWSIGCNGMIVSLQVNIHQEILRAYIEA